MQRDRADFRPFELTKLIDALERKHEQHCVAETRAVAAGKLDARAVSFMQFKRRSVIYYLRELQATQNEKAAGTPPAGEPVSCQ
jgi:hypothetical protein